MISMDNRQRLLDCALELFSLRGYDAVGVREVVEAAGVTKPTLYHYFDSKRGLLEALLQRRLEGF
jgi:AcrR family transcriptional regulator